MYTVQGLAEFIISIIIMSLFYSLHEAGKVDQAMLAFALKNDISTPAGALAIFADNSVQTR